MKGIKAYTKAVLICERWPSPQYTAAGKRSFELINVVTQLADEFVCASADEAALPVLQVQGIQYKSIALNSSTFDKWISEQAPDLIIYDRYYVWEQYAWRVSNALGEVLEILDMQDFHSLRMARAKALNTDHTVEELLLNQELTYREIAAIEAVDLTLVISEVEFTLLTEVFELSKQQLIYFPLLAATKETDPLPFEDREGFVTVGNFLHKPNLDAFRFLRDELWPLLRKQVPSATLNIFGYAGEQYKHEFHFPKKGICCYGFTENLDFHLAKSRLSLAPLRYGAGLKGKVLESLSLGLPIVTTSIGAEGFGSPKDWQLQLADDWDTWVQLAVKLYLNKSAWLDAQQEGRQILSFFEPQKHISTLLEVLSELKSSKVNKADDRSFRQRMFYFHAMRGHKYLSKWIASKSKIN